MDFISTDKNISIEAERCAGLFAAVVAQAVRDACVKPPKPQRGIPPVPAHPDALSAMEFFFGDKSTLGAFCWVSGMNVQAFRQTLLSRVRLRDKGAFTSADRRMLRANYHVWLRLRQVQAKAPA